jgi:hypothetical protein
LNLSPFADQIVLIGRWDSRVGRKVHRHQITVAGRRTLATRTGNLVGIEGPLWCGPRVKGELVWSDVWDDDDVPPYCARVLVHVRDWVVPANGTAKWSEFVQRNRDGTVLAMWSRMPSHMLGKCAESMALRRAFPDTLTPDVLDGFAAYRADLAEDREDWAELVEASAVNAIDEPAGIAVIPERDTPGDDPDEAPFAPIGQGEAHRLVATLDEPERQAFLDRHEIATFAEVWPEAALIDAFDLAGSPVGPAGVGEVTGGAGR